MFFIIYCLFIIILFLFICRGLMLWKILKMLWKFLVSCISILPGQENIEEGRGVEGSGGEVR
jgi:hypothetical protein